MKQMRGWAAMVVSVLVVGGLAAPAEAGRRVRIKTSLSSTGIDPDASGQLQTQITQPKSGLRAKVKVKARRLDPKAPYVVMFNGVPIGTFSTSGSGNGTASFDSQPGRRDQLLGTDPRGMRVEVRSTDGDSVLEAGVPDDSIDPTHIRCCIPQNDDDNEGPECEDRTPDECMAAGGTDLGAGSCLPNPCEAGTPPPPEEQVVCCTPEDDGAECEVRSSASCSEHHGINLGAGSCDPNPCTGPTSPNPETIRCCLPDDSGTECEHRTPDLCVAQGGINIGAGSCSAAACGTTAPPSGAEIRCCEPHSDGEHDTPECETRTEEECSARGGTNLGAGSCDPNPCG